MVLLSAVLLADPAAATPPWTIPAPGQEGWNVLVFPRISRHTRYVPVADSGREAVRAVAHCSASALVYPLHDLDLAKTPLLSWEWKVERAPKIEQTRARSGDDFAARVYVMFAFEPERTTRWERWSWRTLATVFGVEPPGRALNYVWSARERAGASWPNPFTDAARMISRGASELGEWRREEVDVWADYQMSFGTRPTATVGVAIMTDADNSCQDAVAYFARLRFAARGAAHESSEPSRSASIRRR